MTFLGGETIVFNNKLYKLSGSVCFNYKRTYRQVDNGFSLCKWLQHEFFEEYTQMYVLCGVIKKTISKTCYVMFYPYSYKICALYS